MGIAIKHPVPDRVEPSFVIFDIRALWRSARMSKITNDGLTRSGTGCFMAVPIRQQLAARQRINTCNLNVGWCGAGWRGLQATVNMQI